jgi:hypothetical protein
MPHVFVHRRRLHHPVPGMGVGHARHVAWERANTVVYLAGGVIFVAGSVLFFPRFESYADAGAWIFVAGSLLYLVVTVHDLLEVLRFTSRRGMGSLSSRLELAAAAAYVTGTLLYLAGGLFNLSRARRVMSGHDTP